MVTQKGEWDLEPENKGWEGHDLFWGPVREGEAYLSDMGLSGNYRMETGCRQAPF